MVLRTLEKYMRLGKYEKSEAFKAYIFGQFIGSVALEKLIEAVLSHQGRILARRSVHDSVVLLTTQV